MIIMDLNQVMIANFMAQVGKHTNIDIEEGILRHMVLNSIRMYNKKFRDEYGEMIIASDSRNYWRKQKFPFYKLRRQEDREKSDVDWNKLFTVLNIIREELKEFFPYRVINVETAEADDIIGTLVDKHGTLLGDTPPILILSGDKDFIQLQKYTNVKQFDPVRKRWLKTNDPIRFIQEHIIRGDKGDGVPNFLSNDNCLAIKERQKKIMNTKLDLWLDQLKIKKPEQIFDRETYRNYKRNEEMIDLNFIPKDIRNKIIEEYENESGKDRTKLFDYFISRKLKNLHNSVGDF